MKIYTLNKSGILMDLQPGKKWECSKCSKMFRTRKDLVKHMVRHDPDAKVKCQVCGIIYKNRLDLSSHVSRLHSNRKRPSCPTCHRVFSSTSSLKRHVDALHRSKERPRLPCTFPGCEKTYLSKSDVAKHVLTEHAVNPVRFPCSLCGKEFKTRCELEQHIPTHTTEKAYNCATCGRSFALRGNMKRHENTHSEKSTRCRSKCHLCPRTLSNKRGLLRHVRVVHENQRNYRCSFCDKRFPDSSDLKRHVERHAVNKELIYSCDKCEYKSQSKANLATHRVRHNGVMHGCYFCGKKCITFGELVRHCRVHTIEKFKYLCV